MSTNFMFDFLPSFYRDFMVNENGVNVLEPLFTQYANCMGDAIYQAQQLASAPYLEKCPIVIEEYYKAIDLRQSNSLGNNRYKVESDIVGIYDLYYDGALTQLFNYNFFNYFIGHDEANNIRYIEFSQPLDPRITTLYADKVYKDKFLLRDIFGKLLNYEKTFTFKEYWDDQFLIEYEKYRNQLLGILYTSVNGQSLESISKGLSIFMGLSYAPFDGIVKSVNGLDVTIEDFKTGKEQSVRCFIFPKDTLYVGTILKKYDIIDSDQFYLYDMYSDPARFTQFIIALNSENLLNLLISNQSISDNERYAHLTFDSLNVFDGDNLYWDMGNNDGIDLNVPSGNNEIQPPESGLLTNFSNFNDTRFDSQKIYEMFRNLFIIQCSIHDGEGGQSEFLIEDLDYFLTRLKPIYTKYLVDNQYDVNIPGVAPYIIQQPQQYPKGNIGSQSVYQVIAKGSPTLSYQWEKITVTNYNDSSPWTLVGTDSDTLSISITSQDQYVRVIISNEYGRVISQNVLCEAGTGGV